ncbi:MAG TPA: class I SAM-dependent methyltransferase [Thermodesulfobacteriota bacterium]|nr:class I SAM-dependent methyltransferase [Thermodesulfobacteriota bacterium]
MERIDEAWKTDKLVNTFLEGIRGGVPFATEQIDAMMRLVAAMGGPPGRFMDLGCGDGILSRAILSEYPEAKGVLVDFSEPMLKKAGDGMKAFEGNVEIVKADFATEAWLGPVEGDKPFDLIVSGYAIHHQRGERKRALYKEVYGLLAPCGMFVNMDHVSSPAPWIREISDRLFIDALYAYNLGKGTPQSYEEVKESFTQRVDKEANVLSSVEEQCAWLKEAGFNDVDCYFKVFELALFGGRR